MYKKLFVDLIKLILVNYQVHVKLIRHKFQGRNEFLICVTLCNKLVTVGSLHGLYFVSEYD